MSTGVHTNFGKEVESFVGKTFYKLEIFYRELVQEVTKIVILRTPVDTGKAQANWQVATGQPDTSTGDPANRNALAVAEQKMAELEEVDPTDTVWITNNMSYILKLEKGEYPKPGGSKTRDGYSIQAPQGMVAITVAEFYKYMNKAVEVAKTKANSTWTPNVFSNVRHRYHALF